MVYRFSFLRLLYYFYKRRMAYGHIALFHLFQPLIKAFASYDVLVVFILASICPRGVLLFFESGVYRGHGVFILASGRPEVYL